MELLLRTSNVSDLIEKGDNAALKDAMKQGVDRGMQTFDEARHRLVVSGRIGFKEAIEFADSRTDLALRFRLEGLLPQDFSDYLELEEDARHMVDSSDRVR